MQVFLEGQFCSGLTKILHTDSYVILYYQEIILLLISASGICYIKLIILIKILPKEINT